MKKPKTDSSVADLQEKVNQLMQELMKAPAVDQPYSSDVMHELSLEPSLYLFRQPRIIILPQPFEKWTESCKNLPKILLQGAWPNETTDKYSFAFLDRLSDIRREYYFYSGLALYKDQLLPCSFFRRIIFRYKKPEEYAIDPLAYFNNISPECYIGLNISDHTLASWRISRERSLAPIEMELRKVIFGQDKRKITKVNEL